MKQQHYKKLAKLNKKWETYNKLKLVKWRSNMVYSLTKIYKGYAIKWNI